ncbi:MAG: hypothetical protein KC583_12875 [Myxococcales bacterium]|nr:hypothetical protein [Myxococcales bacterium]
MLFTLLLASVAMAGCSVMGVRRHQPHFKTSRQLEGTAGTYRVGTVKAADLSVESTLSATSLSCRLTTFDLPPQTSVATYLRDALTDELDAGRKLAKDGREIGLFVHRFESDTSSLDQGAWHLDITYEIDGRSYRVSTQTPFESAFVATTACANTATALTDALSENFSQLFAKLAR